jgi:hypothetical protein
MQKLRSAIVATYYPDLGIEDADIFVSDGAKCDISRLQVLRGLSLSFCYTTHFNNFKYFPGSMF